MPLALSQGGDGFRTDDGSGQANAGLDGRTVHRGTAASHGSAGFHGRHAQMAAAFRSEEHTSELQSLMCTSYAVFGLKKKRNEERVLNRRTASTGETQVKLHAYHKTGIHSNSNTTIQ